VTKRIIRTWAAVAVLLVLFPRFVWLNEGMKCGAGWGFLFIGSCSDERGQALMVDVSLLAIMEVVAAAVAVGFLYVEKARP
jgi:hypothetical protein